MLPPRSKSQTKGLLVTLLLSLGIVIAVVSVRVREPSSMAQTAAKNDELKPVTPSDQKANEARQAMVQADTLSDEWQEASLRRAIEEYDRAAQIWSSIGDFTNASRATIRSGEVYFVLSKYPDALKRYQHARALALKKRDRLAEASALAQMALVHSYLGDNDVAQEHATKALKILKNDLNDPTARSAYGKALIVFGEIIYAKGNLPEASSQFDEALKYLEDDPEGRAKAHLFKAYTFGRRNRDQAVAEISQALELYRAINNKRGEALALTVMGLSHSLKRDEDRAIELHNDALKIFRDIGDRHSEAMALNAMGQAYENVKQYKNALNYYENGLRLFDEIGARDGALTNCAVARMHHQIGILDKALTYYGLCLKLNRDAGKIGAVPYALDQMAQVYAEQGSHDLALQHSRRSQEIYKAMGDLRGQLKGLNTNGEILLRAGQTQKALEQFNKALPLTEKVRDQGIQISTLYNLAIAHLKLGSLETAERFIRDSIEIIESVRANLGSPDFRLSYFSGVQKHYQLNSEILMQLNRLHPGQGHDVESFRASEKGRARLLLELITDSRADLRLGPRNARLLTFLGSDPLTLEQIQNELRDSDTMVLEYALGDERSYVWAITANSFHSYELASRKEIEGLADEVYELISVRRGVDEASDPYYSAKLDQLSKVLLGPLAEQVGNRRLVIITEGKLQYIPFDVLPLPTGQLINTNEVTASPSISTLIEIRRRARQHTSSTSKLVAVIADPVFSPSDDRVQSAATSSSSALAATGLDLSDALEAPAFTRLVHASEEADTIAAKAPRGTTLVAKGFDATRETAMSSDVAQYQIVHFATHGVLDSERPEQSGIVLTSVDRNGVKTNGLMPLQDIYNLDLSADLTVLSACQTALGKDVKGEGFIGLTHGILSAGSKSVVASLWKVDDRATAVLMGHFYDAMLQEGLSPAAALRSAKLEMMRNPQWSEPYFWAGFVLQGEYTNHIAVDHYSWFRSPVMFLFLLLPIAAGLLIYQRRKRRLFSSKST